MHVVCCYNIPYKKWYLYCVENEGRQTDHVKLFSALKFRIEKGKREKGKGKRKIITSYRKIEYQVQPDYSIRYLTFKSFLEPPVRIACEHASMRLSRGV